ncbi:baseplate J/gp47 family protein [Aneurinibacillus aneurinilyticus]|uniref:baseplate J/gp47 family protein n=1 Tax=Aneurinibacillus aneurinilyticus TaxID=1391 RepID=UPI0035238CC2
MNPPWIEEESEDILQRMLNDVPDYRDKREGGIIFDFLATVANERIRSRKENLELMEMHFTDTATGEDLDRVIESRSPLKRGEAKPAKGPVRVIGIPGTKLPAGTLYMSIMPDEQSGLVEFEQLEDAVIGEDGTVIVEVEAMLGGQVGNIPAGTIAISEPIPGIADVENLEDFKDGIDEEDDDSFRERYHTWAQSDASSGNIDHYVKWAFEVPGGGVGGVQVIPLWSGRGTVKVILIDTDGKPAGPDVIRRVQEYIAPIQEEGEGQAPIGATVTVVPAEETALNVSAKLVLTGTRSIEAITTELSSKLSEFLTKEARANWNRRAQSYYISAGRVGSLIWGIEGVKDYLELTVNRDASSVEIEGGKVAVLGTVTFYE